MRDATGELHSLQTIAGDGEKLYLTGGRKQGCYFAIGKPNGALCIAEGFATGASIVGGDGTSMPPRAARLQAPSRRSAP